jgi:hypothetical protein
MNLPIYAIEIQYIDTIILERPDELLSVHRFTMTEDGLFIIPDQRGRDIKIYDRKGSRTHVWGRSGRGPGEFVTPWQCDYRAPFLWIYDFGRFEMMLFKRQGPINFHYESARKGVVGVFDFCIWRDKVAIAGYITSAEGKKAKGYDVYLLDMSTGEIDYLMPSYRKYGFDSEREYSVQYKNIRKLGQISHLHVHHDVLYHAWHARMNIVRIDLKSRKLAVFGTKTSLYREPFVTGALKKYYGERGSGKIINEEMQRFSYVSGIFASNDFIGVLFENYHKESSAWKPVLQIYDLQGNLIKESSLAEAQFYDRRGIPFFFKEDENALFIISGIIEGDGGIRHEIVQYRIHN